MKHIAHVTDTELIEAVKNGLSKSPKSLPSWLLYDATGDELFQLIMRLPEYYPTRCEYEILSKHKEDFARYFIDKGQSFHLIELGAGDGTKTELLLDALQHAAAKFRYSPVDISDSVLEQLNKKLRVRYPELPIQPLHGSYEDAFRLLEPATRKVVLFLGANIGNMTLTQVNKFLTQTSTRLSRNDMMVIGFDLKKDPRIIQAAYDDKSGVTRQFNLNLLNRLNRSLGAQFILSEFEHYPTYNPETGTAASYLVSLRDQDVFIKALNTTLHFSQWETVHTEISQKFDLLLIERLLSSSGFDIADLFFDKDHYFCDVIAVKR